jgi:hypothetical protein
MIRGRRPVDEPRADCAWCRSADSIEHGICQICLAEYPLDTEVIDLSPERERRVSLEAASDTSVSA